MGAPFPIVVGIDFEPTGDEAARMAVELASEIPNAELHLVSVVAEQTGMMLGADHLAMDERLLAEASTNLKIYAEKLRLAYEGPAFVRNVRLHVRLGDAAEAIHQVAIDVDAELIVVGTHQTTGIAKWLLGSVSEKLLHIARLPVLVARPKDFTGMTKTERPEPASPEATSEEYFHRAPTYELRDVEFGARVPTRVSGGI